LIKDASVYSSSKFTSPRNISFIGDIEGNSNFDGSSDISIPLALKTFQNISGSYNTATSITQLTIDNKGRITAVSAPIEIKPLWSSIQNTPTKLSEYGITDAFTKLEIEQLLASTPSSNSFLDKFVSEKLNASSTIFEKNPDESLKSIKYFTNADLMYLVDFVYDLSGNLVEKRITRESDQQTVTKTFNYVNGSLTSII
jgi:hypothetical protein